MNNAMKMLRLLYNAFIFMLVLELAIEEYSRIKSVIQFFKQISVSVRVKNRDEQSQNNHHSQREASEEVDRIMLRWVSRL